jgi:hypothetical protein
MRVEWFKIKEVIIPNIAVSTVNETNNHLVFYEDDASKKVAMLTPGYYNSATFPSLLQESMEAAGEQTYDVSFDSTTKKVTIQSNAPFKIGNMESGTTAWRILGSERDSSPNKASIYTMPAQVDLSNTGVFLLCSTSLNSNYIRYVAGTGSQMNVLCMVPNTQSGNIIHHEPDSDWAYCGSDISQLDLLLIDAQTHKLLHLRSPMFIRLAVADDIDDVPQG